MCMAELQRLSVNLRMVRCELLDGLVDYGGEDYA
jgi:hypothetical protein